MKRIEIKGRIKQVQCCPKDPANKMSIKKLTPLMEQYYQIKEKCPDAILLFRIGDFYETFAEDASIVARDLNIVLTSRQKDDEGNRIPLAGVPYHALDAYLGKLIRAGHKVAICEQIEDPKLAKGLVKRDITRIVTPGTIIDPSMLEETSNNFLASIAREDNRLGIAFVDISTGEFLTAEIDTERLASELAKFRPVECIAPFPLSWEGSRIQILDESCFSSENARQYLGNQFGPDWAQRLRFSDKDLCARACGAALYYLHKSHFKDLDHLSEITIYSGSEFMALDEITLRNLEILRNIRNRSKRDTLLDLLDQTKTPMGARALSRWIQMPLLSIEKIKRRLDAVDEICRDSFLRENMAEGLKKISDLERLIGRVSLGTANPKDLSVLKNALKRLPVLTQTLETVESPYLKELRSRLTSLEIVTELIEKSLGDDPPVSIRDGGIINNGFNEELDNLRAILRDGRDWISSLEGLERRRTGIKSLKVGYNNVFGYYLEVTKPNLHFVPPDYVRKQTLSNAERFVTPELKEMEAKVISAQERTISLEQEIFNRVRADVATYAKQIQTRAVALGEIDVLLSFAAVATDNSFVVPEFNCEGKITLRGCKHPVLDKTMRGGFVPNDCYMDNNHDRLIILTGPNMSGKSTFMRQIALSLILAQAGSFVPAEFASLCLVDRIFTRVGAYDDLSAGQSTFMVEMSELANILISSTKDSLVLLDEVGRGTSTFDGLSIAWAISEYLHNVVKCKTIFATHYHQLTRLEGMLQGVKNYNVAVKEEEDSVTFLRTIVPGATDKSYGVHVARLAGVPQYVTNRADEILREIEKNGSIEPLSRTAKARKSPKYTQLIFFNGPENKNARETISHLVIDSILKLDIDSLPPRDALDKLAEYQKILRDNR